MSAFFSQLERKTEKLPLRERKKLPLRGKRTKRLKYLKQFEVDQLYTFTEYIMADLPSDLPRDLLVEDISNGQHRIYCN